MEERKITMQWNRRAFLKGMGLSALAVAGVALPPAFTRPAATAAKAGRFVYAWTAFDILDPHIKYDTNVTFFTLNRYDSLLRYQGNPPEIVPWLAEQADVADGGKRWTFHLRRVVQFHDGSELTAEAVRFSFERLLTSAKDRQGCSSAWG